MTTQAKDDGVNEVCWDNASTKCIHHHTLIFSLGVSALLSLMASVVPAAFTEVLATGSGGANDAEVHIEKAMGDVLEDVGVDACSVRLAGRI